MKNILLFAVIFISLLLISPNVHADQITLNDGQLIIGQIEEATFLIGASKCIWGERCPTTFRSRVGPQSKALGIPTG